MPGGQRRLANVRKLMRLAREHAAAHGPDLRGFLPPAPAGLSVFPETGYAVVRTDER